MVRGGVVVTGCAAGVGAAAGGAAGAGCAAGTRVAVGLGAWAGGWVAAPPSEILLCFLDLHVSRSHEAESLWV